MIARVGCIVEGHGEHEAVPILIRRIAERIDPALAVAIPNPIRGHRDRLVKAGELERAVDLAGRNVAPHGGVLVVLDANDDCPAQLGPELLGRAIGARSDLPVRVVLAKPEFEAWILASASSIAGRRGLPDDLRPPANPEDVRGAKEWLRDRMPVGSKYAPRVDQPALTAVFDLDVARQADSFDKCYRDVESMLTELMVRERQ